MTTWKYFLFLGPVVWMATFTVKPQHRFELWLLRWSGVNFYVHWYRLVFQVLDGWTDICRWLWERRSVVAVYFASWIWNPSWCVVWLEFLVRWFYWHLLSVEFGRCNFFFSPFVNNFFFMMSQKCWRRRSCLICITCIKLIAWAIWVWYLIINTWRALGRAHTSAM